MKSLSPFKKTNWITLKTKGEKQQRQEVIEPKNYPRRQTGDESKESGLLCLTGHSCCQNVFALSSPLRSDVFKSLINVSFFIDIKNHGRNSH